MVSECWILGLFETVAGQQEDTGNAACTVVGYENDALAYTVNVLVGKVSHSKKLIFCKLLDKWLHTVDMLDEFNGHEQTTCLE